jgi:hypothetical protein
MGRRIRAPQIDEISEMVDPVLRNLWITQAYHDFAAGLAAISGSSNATWCSFAVWASKSAGSVIRGDELPGRVRELVAASHQVSSQIGEVNKHGRRRRGIILELTHTHAGEAIDRVMEEVSAQIAAGNLLVFQELGPIFAGLLDAFEFGPRPDVDDFEQVLGRYLGSRGVEDPLVIAFDQYWRALFEKDERVHTSLILAGNINAVSHEQQRLQVAIAAALDAAVDDSLRVVFEPRINRLLYLTPVWRRLDRAIDGLCTELGHVSQTVATERMMRLATADEILVFHEDLPAPAGAELFPADLVDISLPELATALDRWDRTGRTGKGTAVRDWAALEERMNYIVNLFRSRQQHPPILAAPFTELQLQAMCEGRLPSGPL